MTGPRDWDKEMADIDRLLAAEKSAPPSAAPQPAAMVKGGGAPVAPTFRPTVAATTSRPRDAIGVWLKMLLGALGGAALLTWPYGKSCGTPLYLYLLGVTAVGAAGVWAMRGAWTHRRGWAHVAGLLVFLLGCGLAAAEILPRIGYAAPALTWTCS